MGRGIALACGEAGAHVVVASRRENGVDVVDEIVARGGAASWSECDVADPTPSRGRSRTPSNAPAACTRSCTTPPATGRVSHTDSRTSSRTVGTARVGVVRGAYHCAVAGLPALQASHGTLVVMTSPAGIEGSATLPLYATMKGALRGFAKSLAREWAPHGVTVNVVSPLAFSPAMVNAIAEDPDMEGAAEPAGAARARRRSGDRCGARRGVPPERRCLVRHRPDAGRRRRPLHEPVSQKDGPRKMARTVLITGATRASAAASPTRSHDAAIGSCSSAAAPTRTEQGRAAGDLGGVAAELRELRGARCRRSTPISCSTAEAERVVRRGPGVVRHARRAGEQRRRDLHRPVPRDPAVPLEDRARPQPPAPVTLIQGFLPGMLERDAGRIINITSSAARTREIPATNVPQLSYAASKAALDSFSYGSCTTSRHRHRARPGRTGRAHRIGRVPPDRPALRRPEATDGAHGTVR